MPIRNPVVRHGAILRKGGAHTSKMQGQQRHQSKRQLDNEIDEYFNQRENLTENSPSEKPSKGRNNSAPSSLCFYLAATCGVTTVPNLPQLTPSL